MDSNDIKWNTEAEEIFNKIVDNLPQFHRNIAKQLVKERAENLARERNSQFVENKDLITAFLKEVPPAFKDGMKRLFTHLNIDYTKYIPSQEFAKEASN